MSEPVFNVKKKWCLTFNENHPHTVGVPWESAFKSWGLSGRLTEEPASPSTAPSEDYSLSTHDGFSK